MPGLSSDETKRRVAPGMVRATVFPIPQTCRQAAPPKMSSTKTSLRKISSDAAWCRHQNTRQQPARGWA
eukprot:5671218-Pyramimonas_sp.AAC.1